MAHPGLLGDVENIFVLPGMYVSGTLNIRTGKYICSVSCHLCYCTTLIATFDFER